MADKNLRPYMISCDWLQLYLQKTSNFDPNSQNLFGYQFEDVGHGSKVFKKIYSVIEPTGEILGNISLDPYSTNIPASSVILKVENNVLYQADYIERIFHFIAATGLRYRGITRIDIAYDSNELYGGLKHQTLIKKYRSNEYLKIGASEYFMHCKARYHLSVDKKGRKILTDKAPSKKGSSGQEPEPDPRPIQNLQEHQTNSITWGSRSSDVQVQLYDKSKELREVKMKHYIVDGWEKAGIDTERPVYRIEIRIVNEGKSLKNLKTGEKFTLSMNDLVTQELLEQLFHDYAKKVFRFYHRRDITHIQRMKEVRIFSLTNQTIIRPKRNTKQKDYTRMHKMVMNWLDKNIAENARQDNVIVRELERTKEYFIAAYGMEKYIKEKEEELQYLEEVNARTIKTPQEYYRDKFAGIHNDTARRAAEEWRKHEEAFLNMKIAIEDEDQDISLDMYHDILTLENNLPF